MRNINPYISVIIPIYGVEKYIERCVRHLFEQTLDNIEYIFVNDKTQDASIDILHEIIKEYPNIRKNVIIISHEENKGLPQARKTGVAYATGEYVAHCDSDDYIDKDMYRQMYIKAKEENLDMVVCDYYTDTDKTIEYQLITKPKSKHEIIAQMFMGKFPSYMWNKLVKRNIIQSQDIQWPVDNMWEDMATMAQIVPKINRIGYVMNPLYYYVKRENSIVNARNDKQNVIKKWHQVKNNVEIILKSGIINESSDEIIVLKSRARSHLIPLINDNEIWRIYKNAYPNILISIVKCKLLTIRQKISNILYSSFWLHKLAFKISRYSKSV